VRRMLLPTTAIRPAQFRSGKFGSLGKIRTCDQPINSRLLYR
jgi:hypothetical protein